MQPVYCRLGLGNPEPIHPQLITYMPPSNASILSASSPPSPKSLAPSNSGCQRHTNRPSRGPRRSQPRTIQPSALHRSRRRPRLVLTTTPSSSSLWGSFDDAIHVVAAVRCGGARMAPFVVSKAAERHVQLAKRTPWYKAGYGMYLLYRVSRACCMFCQDAHAWRCVCTVAARARPALAPTVSSGALSSESESFMGVL